MQKEQMSGIYCIEHIISNKKYIGQSVDVYDRWKKHVSELKHNNHHNAYLQNSWNKYGEDSFKFYVLEYCSADELNDKERYYIDFYNTMDRNYGYNMKSGGQDHNYQSEEIRKKISESNKKKYNESNLRKIRSVDALNQWSNPEIKEKIMGKNNGMYGKHHTDESKQKISEKATGRTSPKRNTTPVICIELNKIFKDAVTACKELGLSSTGGIFGVCRGERKTCGGYHWEFLIRE